MSLLIYPASILAIFFLCSLLWGMRGAIVCFAAVPAIGFVLGSIWPPAMVFWGLPLDSVQTVFAIVAAVGWASVMIWLLGFPAAAIGIALRRKP